MSELTLPIKIDLPEDWIEQIIERLRNDPDAEWVEIIRCKYCCHDDNCAIQDIAQTGNNFFCGLAERREE